MRWIKAKISELYDKIVKEQKPAGFIARGWALGVFVGSVIPFGFQIYISLPLSFLLRCSKIGALTGTLITNPITIIFIYPAQCWIGSRIIGKALSWDSVTKAMNDLIAHQDWATLMKLSGDLIASFFVGGFLLAAIATPIAYFAVLSMVRAYRRSAEETKR
jgi:uncharacterized protein (DUF2062 family)